MHGRVICAVKAWKCHFSAFPGGRIGKPPHMWRGSRAKASLGEPRVRPTWIPQERLICVCWPRATCADPNEPLECRSASCSLHSLECRLEWLTLSHPTWFDGLLCTFLSLAPTHNAAPHYHHRHPGGHRRHALCLPIRRHPFIRRPRHLRPPLPTLSNSAQRSKA